jgi:hypothetical protein
MEYDFWENHSPFFVLLGSKKPLPDWRVECDEM